MVNIFFSLKPVFDRFLKYECFYERRSNKLYMTGSMNFSFELFSDKLDLDVFLVDCSVTTHLNVKDSGMKCLSMP